MLPPNTALKSERCLYTYFNSIYINFQANTKKPMDLTCSPSANSMAEILFQLHSSHSTKGRFPVLHFLYIFCDLKKCQRSHAGSCRAWNCFRRQTLNKVEQTQDKSCPLQPECCFHLHVKTAVGCLPAMSSEARPRYCYASHSAHVPLSSLAAMHRQQKCHRPYW